MRPYIKIESLSKSYGNHRVLSNLKLSINRGETVAITGPSGCGKTTLLNILGLLESYDSGAAHLCGKALPKIESNQAMLLRRYEITTSSNHSPLSIQEPCETTLCSPCTTQS